MTTERPYQPLRSRSRSTGTPKSSIPILGAYKREKIRDLRASRGIPNLVPAAEVREHLRFLIDLGFTNHSIAAAAGVGVSTIKQIARGAYATSKIDAAARIMAVTHKPILIQTGMRVPAIGTRRRIHALYSIGWTADDIGKRLDVTASAVTSYTRQHRVMYDIWEAIDSVYETMSGTRGPSQLGVSRSWARGFAPPMAWDGFDIDNPSHRPDYGGSDVGDLTVDEVAFARILAGKHSGRIAKPERVAVLDHAIANGWNRSDVANALNLSRESADRALVRHRAKRSKEAA